MKTIIVPTDFSAASKNAAFYAVDFAKAIHADLILLHSVSIPIAIAEVQTTSETIDLLEEDAEESIKQLKDALTEHSAGAVNIATTVTIGGLLNDINNAANINETIAIVMGVNGSGGTERLILGSNSMAAMRDLEYPVLIVPCDAKFTKIKKVGVAWDLKNIAEIMPAKDIKRLLDAVNGELHFIYVSTSFDPHKPKTFPSAGSLQATFSAYDPKFHFASGHTIEEAIADSAVQNQIDLLITIPINHGFIGSMFHRSVSKEIALHLPIPIMALHAI